MRLKTQASSEYRLQRSEGSKVWELATRAALLERAGTSDLADLLLDIPVGLRRALIDFSEGSSEDGAFLVRGLPVGTLPDTPREYGGQKLVQHGTTGILMLVADLLGTLIGYQDEKSGALIHEVHPVPGEETRIENSGAVAFDFHTENVHHPLRPDFLGLLCLRQDHEAVAATRVASVRRAHRLLSADQLETLRAPVFSSAYPTSFSRNIAGPRPASGPHPVLFGEEPDLFMRFNSHTTTSADPRAQAALKALSEALEEVCQDIVLEPGDLVIVDNHIAAHGRSAFTPRFDGQDRWLRRCYSLRAVPRWAESMMRRPRVLPELAHITGVF
ncbi:TauD/TfdA family dioxygenase [Streptomyces lavendulocolor]|uniref:TauD/TfdA family dioxygenase n=1 Tax=Streptomyces lavendulocolor TaxID=67316 RepID=UPI003C2F65D8